MPDLSVLHNVPLFAGLPGDDLAKLAGVLVRRTFAKGVNILLQGSPGTALHIIETGRVRVFLLNDLGNEMSINIFGPGQVLGEMSLLDGLPRSASAVALEQTVTLALERSDFLQFLEAHPRVARNTIEMLTGRLRYLTTYAQSLVFLDVYGRLAAKLLELISWNCTPGNDEIEMGLTQSELATWVAASRETVNRALNYFEDQGLLRLDGQRITVLDRHGLQRMVQM